MLNLVGMEAGPIAKQSKSSDLDWGRGDPGSNPGEGMCLFLYSEFYACIS